MENTRHHVLAVVGGEKGLQVIITEGGVFDVNLPHDADLDRGAGGIGGQVCEVLHEAEKHPAHGAASVSRALRIELFEPLQPALCQGIRAAGGELIRTLLVRCEHEGISVHHGGERVSQHAHIDAEARILLHALHVQADDRYMSKTRRVQCPPQQVDVIRGAASSCRL